MIVLTSWDDGYPSDLRIANLLSKFGLKGTFFLPLNNIEGRAVLTSSQIKLIASNFEIGGHTLDHVYLNSLSHENLKRQVIQCRLKLMDLISNPVHGFCYPGGKVTPAAEMAVREAGFTYARTIVNLNYDIYSDQYRMPTTIQFFPHSKTAYLSNYLRYGFYKTRISALKQIFSANSFQERLRALADDCLTKGKVFHIWGHSWEIDEYHLWEELESFFSYLASLPHEAKNLNEIIA